jgi:protein HIRA/HIR1
MGNPFGRNGGNESRRGFIGSPAPEDPFYNGLNDTPMVDALFQDESPTRRPAKARTLGGDLVRENVAVRVLDHGGFGASGGASGGGAEGVELESPSLKNVLAAGVGDDTLEARNMEDESENSYLLQLQSVSLIMAAEPTELSYTTGKVATVQWLDYLPSAVVLLTLNTVFGAVACINGTVNVYSLTGRR